MFPKVSIPSPLARSALSLASWGFSTLGVTGLNAGVLLLLKFIAVCCSCNVARVGLTGVELGRLKDCAKGLFEPVGVGLIA